MIIRLFLVSSIFIGFVQNCYSWSFFSKKKEECNSVDTIKLNKTVDTFKEIMIAMTCPETEEGSSSCFDAGKLSCRLSFLGRGGIKVVNKGKCCEKEGFFHQEKNCREKAISFTCPKGEFDQFIEKNNKINEKIKLLGKYSSGDIVTVEYNSSNSVLFEKLKGKSEMFKKAPVQKCVFLIQNVFNRGNLLDLNVKNEKELKGIQEDLLCSLYKLRKNSLIHGDIKPQNFLCNQSKENRTECFLHDNDDLQDDKDERNGAFTYMFTYQYEPNMLGSKNKNRVKEGYENLNQQDWIKNDIFAVFRTVHYLLERDFQIDPDPFLDAAYERDKELIDLLNHKGQKNKKRDIAFTYYSNKYPVLLNLASAIDHLNNKDTPWDGGKSEDVLNMVKDAVKLINPDALCLLEVSSH